MIKQILPLTLLLASLPFYGKCQSKPDILSYVKPLTGTKNMGHTYPGATVPFGAVQLSPDTDTIPYSLNGKYNPDAYRYCSGYQYDDKTIVGFSHTHFSGTGHSDLGDILIMPVSGKLQLSPGIASSPESGFRSAYSHSTEVAEPNYYKVFLEDDKITAELTATARTGVHRYTFSKKDTARVIVDLMHGIYSYPGKNVWTFLRVENDTLITGYRQTSGWARTRTVYFAISFSKPFTSYGYKNFSQTVYKGFWRKFNQYSNFPEMAGQEIRAFFNFDLQGDNALEVKVALSPVSTEGAINNMKAEVAGFTFDNVKEQGQKLWRTELEKTIITSADSTILQNFYTSLYHAYINPTIYMDADNRYKGLDQNIHTAEGFTNYTTFSLWDTYRALHPLFNLLQPKRNADMVNSMLAHFDQSVHKMLPVWSHYANENWCMTGYHAVAVIADAIAKDIGGFDYKRALNACISTANADFYDGIGYYKKLGYVPEDRNGSSVSKTLEYAYDDWCIAKIGRQLGDSTVAAEFTKRSKNYHNVYDSSIGFMRPRLSNGKFKADFNVLSTHDQGFIEGNAWNYSLFVPHAPLELIRMMGGEKKFIPHLDSLFTMELPDKYFAETEDITRDGLIGNYVHGNEPSHHIAYFYNFTTKPHKTQKTVRMILEKMYHPTPEGLSGNDDCGQMSAWYIFSALGFYPFAPGSDLYAIGSPNIEAATIKLENGNTLRIIAKNQAPKNIYVKRVMLNGTTLKEMFIKHADLVKGGTLVFEMTDKK